MKKAILHKSFQPAKCKTALKLAVSRIKLLKNKRDAQVKQLKRELAQLLDTGQDQTARIRVEHVVREEKTMAAYDLIEIYCELIVARLPIIESQKNCPIDLKEAIASVIFASPRCADVPELMDVRKHFTAKYGKEFVTAAVELRPDCGVSRLLVEKLSAKAPDGPAKLKILSAIAEEHNIKWDPESFGQKEMKPYEDLLNGPNTFKQASELNTQEPPNIADKGPNFGASSNHHEKLNAPVNSYSSNSRSSSHFQASSSTKAMPSGTSDSDLRHDGNEHKEMEFRHSYAPEQSHSSAGRRGWNMEFKDATAAAQAAAESAEMASLAARAAAELSSLGSSRQHLTESNKAPVLVSKDEGVANHCSSSLQGENLGQVPVNNTYRSSNSQVHHEQSFENEQDDLAGLTERFYNLKSSYKSNQLASAKSSSSSMDYLPQVNDLQMADRHSRMISYESEKSDLLGEINVKEESSESEVEFMDDMHDGLRSDNIGYFKEATIKRKTSVSAHSNSQIRSDDHNVVSGFSQPIFTEEAVNEPFRFDEGNLQRDASDTDAYDNPAAAFDDSGSDGDELKFDVKGNDDGHDGSRYYFSEGNKPSSHLLATTSAKSPWLNMQTSLGKSDSESYFASDSHSTAVFSEGLTSHTVPPHEGNLLPVTFDNSDGPSSDSEGELDEAKLAGNQRSGIFLHDDVSYSNNLEKTENANKYSMGSSLADREIVGFGRKTWLQPSAVDSVVELHSKKTQGMEVDTEIETSRKFGYGYFNAKQNSSTLAKSQSSSNHNANQSLVEDDVHKYETPDTLEDSDPIKDPSLGGGKELNFGTLTGGLRNKAFRHPPYRRNASNSSSVSKQVEEENSTRIEGPSSLHKVGFASGAHEQEPYNQAVHQKVNEKTISGNRYLSSDSDDHDLDEELPRQSLAKGQEAVIRKAANERNQNSGLWNYFESDKSDSEEDLPKETPTSKARLDPAFSRRTRGAVPSSDRDSSLKSRTPLKSSTVGYDVAQKLYSASSYAPKSQVNSPSQTKGGFKQGRSPEQASSNPVSEYKRPIHKESSSKSSQRSKSPQNHTSQSNSSDYRKKSEQLKSAEPSKSVASGDSQSTTSNSRADPPSRENSLNKASHVHPKLPDYDTLTAHLLSLRQNRQ